MRTPARDTMRTATPGRLLAPLLILGLGGCVDAGLTGLDSQLEVVFEPSGRSGATARLTGALDLVWPGGKGMNAPDDDRLAQAVIAAFEGIGPEDPGSGTFFYRVVAADGSLHREIGVELTWVGRDPGDPSDEIRFVGRVVSDTKPCGGSGHGGPGGGGEDTGDAHEGDGCSHEDGTTHDEGGCTHEDGETHDEGGCSGSDDHGGPAGPAGPVEKVNGSDCRLGQIVIGWAKDAGTPAVAGDRVSWKWMSPEAPKVLAIQAAIGAGLEIPWPCHLCEKEILGGNLRLALLRQ